MTNVVYEMPYHNFAAVKQKVQGLQAIDYFFAKDMLAALSQDQITDHNTDEQNTNDQNTEDQGTKSSSNHSEVISHVLLALSESLRAGHSCLPLAELANTQWGYANDQFGQRSHEGIMFPNLETLTQAINTLLLTPSHNKPIVFHQGKLYLRRYYQFELELSETISTRLATGSTFNNDDIAACIEALFPENANDEDELDWQKIAVANSLNKYFSVIAGGPGTGKTYTVTKLLAALVMLDTKDSLKNNNEKSALNIALVAPTGKAAQRLSESIVNAVAGFSQLIDQAVLAQIPTTAQTIHRLLGVIPNSPNFRHGNHNKLPFDVVLIDEVSMVDLPLMTRVFRALKSHTKVILLGDADQLPSVAAGSVLADIAPRPHHGFTQPNYDYLAKVCQLNADLLPQAFAETGHCKVSERNDYLTYLLKSRRFDGEGGIGLLAKAVIAGDSKGSWLLLNQAQQKASVERKASQLSLATGEFSSWLVPLVKQYFQPIEYCTDVSKAFTLLSQFRVLCATRKGTYGVEAMNDFIKRYLGKGFSNQYSEQQGLYHGQPIMISENNYRLGLYNGDIGIIWSVVDSEHRKHLMACFETSDNNQPIRHILPSRLPKYETVYAMTIHKTQGSEFDHVAMLLSANQSTNEIDNEPNENKVESKLLSRELLYTAITRAKTQLTVASDHRTWHYGVLAQVKRHSGLVLESNI